MALYLDKNGVENHQNVLKHPNNIHNKCFSMMILPNGLPGVSMCDMACGQFHVESATVRLQVKEYVQERSFLRV